MAAQKLKPVYAVASHVVSPLGLDASAHWQAIGMGKTGIQQHTDFSLSKEPFFAARLAPEHWQYIHGQIPPHFSLSAFEQLVYFSAKQAIEDAEIDADSNDTAFILSTTKGNIELLGQVPDNKIRLNHSAKMVAKYLNINTKPVVISHACISGLSALIYGMRLIQNGRYKNVIVTGCDRFSAFVLNGFQAFQAVSPVPCMPFDADRAGVSLGEAAATIILSVTPGESDKILLASGSISNDANHISGPSRTGEELALAIQNALNEAGKTAAEVDIISAHGTGTIYNDEMESKAFGIVGLEKKPLHSLKGYTGHTLGASGIVESAMLLQSIRYQQSIISLGYRTCGTSVPLNVSTKKENKTINNALKTASGFGGSNAAVIWQRAD